MTQDERTRKYNRLIRDLCAYEIRMGETMGYAEAVRYSHRPGGPREIIKRLYGQEPCECDG
jgi:hypothetical protein